MLAWQRMWGQNRLLVYLLGLVLVSGLGMAIWAAAVGASAGGELAVNLGTAPASLDPQVAEGLSSRTLLLQLLDGLYAYDKDLSLKPVVAQALPLVSEDRLTYTIVLNPKARWSDGRPVTAYEFVYSIQRLFALNHPQAFLFRDLKGAPEILEALSQSKEVPLEQLGVSALNESTLQFRLGRPASPFLHYLTLPAAFPVRPDIVEASGPSWAEPGKYPGNGPFLLAERTKEHILLAANSQYWGPRPRLGRLRAVFLPDPQAAMKAYLEGKLDLVEAVVTRGTASPRLLEQVRRAPRAVTLALLFNMASPPFEKVKVRQAMATALNRQAFVEGSLAGTGSPALGWIPPGIPGHNPEIGQDYAFNPSKAQALLKEAGYEGGKGLPALRFQHEDTDTGRAIARFVSEELKRSLNLSLKLEALKPEDFEKIVKEKRHTLTYFIWSADYAHPDAFFTPLFVAGAPYNYSGFRDPRFEELLQKARASSDPLEEPRLWEEVHRYLLSQMPMAGIAFVERSVLVKPQVRGLTTTPIDGAIPGEMFLRQVSR